MSIVEDELVKHPPLELLLTVEEEMGVVGADDLDPALLSGKTLINIDSETEGVFTVGCAGGGSVNITLPVIWEIQKQDEVAFGLRVSGLQGGHSGEDINKFRTNANKLIARILDGIQRNIPIRLSTLRGGQRATPFHVTGKQYSFVQPTKKKHARKFSPFFRQPSKVNLPKRNWDLCYL